jgi:hypothetical protein
MYKKLDGLLNSNESGNKEGSSCHCQQLRLHRPSNFHEVRPVKEQNTINKLERLYLKIEFYLFNFNLVREIFLNKPQIAHHNRKLHYSH